MLSSCTRRRQRCATTEQHAKPSREFIPQTITHTHTHTPTQRYMYIHSFTVIYTRLYEGDGACVCIVYYYTGPFTGQFGKAGNHNSPTREMLKAFPKSSRSCTHPPVDPPPQPLGTLRRSV